MYRWTDRLDAKNAIIYGRYLTQMLKSVVNAVLTANLILNDIYAEMSEEKTRITNA